MEGFLVLTILTVVFAVVWAVVVAFYIALPLAVLYFIYRAIRMLKNGY